MKQIQEQQQKPDQPKTDPPICPDCETNSGRTNANRSCCKLRRLALAPRHQQAAFAAGLTEVERNELRPRLVAEIKRLKGL
jgi:hypothetical protein